MNDVSRRHFIEVLSGLAFSAPLLFSRYASASSTSDHVKLLRLEPNSWVPNNPHLPVILYSDVLPHASEMTHPTESLFEQNDWPPQWVASIFSFHHYHSTAHEVLGCISGTAQVMLGGPGGQLVTMTAGDVALLPAGTGHCNQGSSADFQVVGAYPPQQQWDICRAAPTAEMLQRISQLPFPESDPVAGRGGPLTRNWRRA
ncbi:MAG: cupin [Pantoea sp.]|uniref:cupin n=1 Tax=Pantoea sp. TaxID=69393 RepID=UPI0039E5FF54